MRRRCAAGNRVRGEARLRRFQDSRMEMPSKDTAPPLHTHPSSLSPHPFILSLYRISAQVMREISSPGGAGGRKGLGRDAGVDAVAAFDEVEVDAGGCAHNLVHCEEVAARFEGAFAHVQRPLSGQINAPQITLNLL
jgi:hypothetical protein